MRVPFFDLAAANAEIKSDVDEVWQDITRNSSFIGGPYVERFEHEWAAYCGTKHAVGVANGTAALQLSLQALGIGVGDEVIVPSNTFVATAEAVIASGATPVFIDVDPATLLMTADGVRAAITQRTAAVIPVHLFGQTVDMDAVRAVTSAAGLALIEDAAQAQGATWRGKRAGGLADIGCFSFYPGKNLGAFGDAGAVATDDGSLADRIRSLGNHGRLQDTPGHHQPRGRNERLDGLQAAVLSVKLTRLDDWNEQRRRIARKYQAAFSDGSARMVALAPNAVSSHHLAVLQTPHRNALRARLAIADIGTSVHYPVPCHQQPEYAHENLRLPVVENAAESIVSLPMFPHLDDADVDFVIETLERIIAEFDAASPLAS